MKKIGFVLVFLFATFQVFAQITVKVIVEDVNGIRIPNVEVLLGNEKKLTDSHGTAIFENLSKISYTLKVRKKGYEEFVRIITPEIDTTIKVTLYSEERGVCAGTFYLGEKPADIFVVRIYDINGEILGNAVTNSNGQFSFVTSIDRRCLVFLDEYPNQKFYLLPTQSPESKILKVETSPKYATLNLEIVDSQGLPLEVDVYLRRGYLFYHKKTLSTGKINIENILEGKYTLTLEKKGFGTYSEEIEIHGNVKEKIVFSPNAGEVEIVLKSKNGEYLSGIVVFEGEYGRVVLKVVNGVGRVKLGPGIYDVNVVAEGFSLAKDRIILLPNQKLVKQYFLEEGVFPKEKIEEIIERESNLKIVLAIIIAIILLTILILFFRRKKRGGIPRR